MYQVESMKNRMSRDLMHTLTSYIKADRRLNFSHSLSLSLSLSFSSFKVLEIRTCLDDRLAFCVSLFLISTIGYIAKGGPSFLVKAS